MIESMCANELVRGTHHSPERLGRWFPRVVAIVALAPFVPLLSPDDRVFAVNDLCDYTSYFLPVREFVREEFRAGRTPLWIPWLGGGMPLHAIQQATLYYPLLTPLVVLLPVNCAMRLCLFLHLALCFLGQYRLARWLGISRPGATFSAVVSTQCGHVIAQLMIGHVNQVMSFCLLPWFVLVLLRHLRDATAGSALFLAIVASLLVLTGHPQTPCYAVLIGGLWAIGSLICGVASQHRIRCIGWGIVAVAMTIMLTAIQLLPTFELMRGIAKDDSGRGTVQFASTFALDGYDLLHFIVPNLRGNPFVGIPDFSGFYFFHERAGYIGLAPLVLSLFALSRPSVRRWEWAAAALMALSIIIALGDSTPVFRMLGQVIPGLYLFRCPGRILSVFAVFAGLLAARGLDAAVLDERPGGRHQFAMLGILIWLVVNGTVYIVVSSATRFTWTEYAAFAHKFLQGYFYLSMHCAAGTIAAIWVCRRYGRAAPKRAYGAMLAVLMIDLGLNNATNFHLQEHVVESIPRRLLEIDPPIRYVAVRPSGHLTADSLRYSKSLGLAVANHRSLLGTNDGGVLPRSTEQLFHALAVNTQPALAASACNYEYFVESNSWRRVDKSQSRCRFIPGDRIHLAKLALKDLRLADLAEADLPPTVQPRIVRENSQTIEIECEAAVSGLLVLADIVYPGWVCSVDGTHTLIEAVHGVFRGVNIEAGSHRVTFAFQPQSFRLGCYGSLLGIAAVLVIGGMEFARQRIKSRQRTTI